MLTTHKLCIVGASGKVGRRVVEFLILDKTFSDKNIVLYARRRQRIDGFLLDVRSFVDSHDQTNRYFPHITATDNLKELCDATLIVCCLGHWPDDSLQQRSDLHEHSGRLIQAYSNAPGFQHLVTAIARYAPNTTLLVVTNQSDLLAAFARLSLRAGQVVGFGGTVDSARFRHVAKDLLLASHSSSPDAPPLLVTGHMIGYHNSDMIPLGSSIEVTPSSAFPLLSPLLLDEAMKRTRSFGSLISVLQADDRHPTLDTGASILPAHQIVAFIGSFLGVHRPTIGSYNVHLSDLQASWYGVSSGALSVPLCVSEHAWTPITRPLVSDVEREHLRLAQARFNSDLSTMTREFRHVS